MEPRKKPPFETITSADWAESIRTGRARKNAIVEQFHAEEDRRAYAGINRDQPMTAHDQDLITIRELLLQIVRSYTNNHDHLICEAFLPDPQNRILVLVIQAEQMDFKKLVGSQGRNARALSSLMREIGKGLDLTIETRIKSPVGYVPETTETLPFDESSEFDGKPIASLISVVVSLMTNAPCAVKYVNMAGMTVFLCESPDAPSEHQRETIRQLFMLPGNKVRRQFTVEFT